MSSLATASLGDSTRFPYGIQDHCYVASGVADVLPVRSGVVFVNGTAADLMTLALPKAGYGYGLVSEGLGEVRDDGKHLLIILATAFIDTITTPAGGINGTLHIITFTAVVGNFVELISFNGTWYVLASKGATLS
jgi:hypothetical protein